MDKIADAKPGMLKALNFVLLPMLVLLGIKLLMIWYYTSRPYGGKFGAVLSFPYDTLAFKPFDRFTDWLVTLIASRQTNPYDLSGMPSPYGMLTFVFMRTSDFFGDFGLFLSSLALFIGLNYALLISKIRESSQALLVAFATLLIVFYPLYFEIDRGNTVIFSAVALSLALLSTLKKWPSSIAVACYAVMMCLKPSNGLFLLPLVMLGSWLEIAIAVVAVTFNYSYPVLFLNAKPTYLFDVIAVVGAHLGPLDMWCSNLQCGLRAIGVPVVSVAIVILFMIPALIAVGVLRRKSAAMEASVLSAVLAGLTTLIIVDVTIDYSLIYVLPFFIVLLSTNILSPRTDGEFTLKQKTIMVGFTLAAGFLSLPVPGMHNWFVFVRSLGLVAMDTGLILAVIASREGAKAEPARKETFSRESVRFGL